MYTFYYIKFLEIYKMLTRTLTYRHAKLAGELTICEIPAGHVPGGEMGLGATGKWGVTGGVDDGGGVGGGPGRESGVKVAPVPSHAIIIREVKKIVNEKMVAVLGVG